MIVRRSTKLIGVFDCGVSCLHYLLRDWDVAAIDDAQIDFGLRGLLLYGTSPANVFCFIEEMCGHDKDSWRFQWNSNPRRRNSKFPALTAKLWKRLIGAPGRNRTCNHRLRRPVLYPVELRARKLFTRQWKASSLELRRSEQSSMTTLATYCIEMDDARSSPLTAQCALPSRWRC